MNCHRTEQIIRDAFDRGWEIDLNDPHLKACQSCRAYLEEIQAIEASLENVELEAYPDNLVERIQARVAEERGHGNPAWQWLSWAAAVVFVVSGFAWWVQPEWSGFEAGLGRAVDALPREILLWAETPLPQPAVAAWESALGVTERARNLSGMATGVATSVLLVFLVLFNAGVALRLRASAGPDDNTLSP